MTDTDADTTNRVSGECRVCGVLFVGMTGGEFESAAARHIIDNHRNQPADKPLVIQHE